MYRLPPFMKKRKKKFTHTHDVIEKSLKGDHWLPGNDIVGKELTEKRQEETFEVMKMF